MAIQIGDKLIWRERGKETHVEALSNKLNGMVQVKIKEGSNAAAAVTDLRPDDDDGNEN